MRRLIPVIALSMLCLTKSARSQKSEMKPNDPSQYIQRLMDIQVGFMEMVPTGMSIEAKEISRKGTSGKDLVVQYHIFVKGAPTGTIFEWIQWPVNADKASTVLAGISVGKEGILMCAGKAPKQCGDPKNPDDPIEFVTLPRKGEPTRLAFIAPNVRIGLVILPDPVESKDKGCTLSAVRLTPKFELGFLSGSGYAPNADVHYRVSSAEMTNDHVVKSDSNGTIRVSVIPYPGKKNSGTVSVKIMEGKCAPEVVYEWGKI